MEIFLFFFTQTRSQKGLSMMYYGYLQIRTWKMVQRENPKNWDFPFGNQQPRCPQPQENKTKRTKYVDKWRVGKSEPKKLKVSVFGLECDGWSLVSFGRSIRSSQHLTTKFPAPVFLVDAKLLKFKKTSFAILNSITQVLGTIIAVEKINSIRIATIFFFAPLVCIMSDFLPQMMKKLHNGQWVKSD